VSDRLSERMAIKNWCTVSVSLIDVLPIRAMIAPVVALVIE
jgi:hypothetical protein